MLQDSLSPREIEAAAYTEWLSVLSQLWEAIGKPVDEKRLMIYARQFKDVPLGLLEKAVNRVLRDGSKYTVVAPIATVWAAISKELGDPFDIALAIEGWQEQSWDRLFVHFPGPADGSATVA